MRDRLLFGLPVKCQDIDIYPITIKRLIEFGFDRYQQILNIFVINKQERMELLDILEEIHIFDFILLAIINDIDDIFINLILDFFSMIFNSNVTFDSNGYFYIENTGKSIDKNNIEAIIEILKIQNFIKERPEKILTKKEKEYKEMVRKAKEKYAKALKAFGKDNDSDLLDIISSLCAKHPSLNFLNIQNLTLYQVIDQFKRLNMIDDYFISIDSLLAGASKNDVDMKHWSIKFLD